MSTIGEVNTGIKFYGMNVVDYTLSSVSGQTIDYETLLRKVAIERSVKLEAEVKQYSAAVKSRQKIVDTLGKAMALVEFLATDLAKKGKDKIDENFLYGFTTSSTQYADFQAYTQVSKLTGVSMNGSCSYIPSLNFASIAISKSGSMRDQNNLQYLLDMQNNLLEQDMVAIQSLFNKQSDAFVTAKSLTTKVSETRRNTIQGMG